jgi:hypothetical protein
MKAKTFNRWSLTWTVVISFIVGCILAAYSEGGIIATNCSRLKFRPVPFSVVERGFDAVGTDKLEE